MTSRLLSILVDGATPIMLTTHPYFSLNAFVDPASRDSLDHTLHMPYSRRYVKTDNSEIITGKRLRFFATALLSKCVVVQMEDGFVYVKGRDHYFLVRLDMYDPSDIKCADRSPGPAPSGCKGAFEMMPSDPSPLRYINGDKLNPWDVELPETFLGLQRGAESTCMDVTGEEWFTPAKLWEAAVAIDAVRARRGQMD